MVVGRILGMAGKALAKKFLKSKSGKTFKAMKATPGGKHFWKKAGAGLVVSQGILQSSPLYKRKKKKD
jgi:hypothetical protein